MQIVTDRDAVKIGEENSVTRVDYADGSVTMFPSNLAIGNDGTPWPHAVLYTGKNVLIGVGSMVRYDYFTEHSLRIGRYVSAGQRLRFVLRGTHNTDTITTWGGASRTLASRAVRERTTAI